GKQDRIVATASPRRSEFAGGIARTVARRPGAVALTLLTLGVALGSQAPRVELEDNLMEMEAEGLESVALQDVMVDEFGLAPDVLYLISEDRSELPSMVDDLEDLESVKTVDAITNWWPMEDEQAQRVTYLRDIRGNLAAWQSSAEPELDLLIEELYRLEANLVEMGDLAVLGGTDRAAFALNRATGLDADGTKVAPSVFDRLFATLESGEGYSDSLVVYRDAFSHRLAERLSEMAGAEEVTLDNLPPATRDTFLSRDGASTLATISPRRNPWHGRYRTVFTAQVATVTDRGTGMILAADQLTDIAQRDGVRAMIAALIAVCAILLIDFGNLRLVALTFAPLLLAFASLYGVMALFDIKFDFINIIAIPLLVGIGVDNSVHINHRYLLEGRGNMATALSRTGSAVALTTATTMIGFASFIPSIMRAMRSTGIVLTVAMALAFIYAVLFHPAVLVIASERWKWNLSPRLFGKEDR
ncbi:MAG: MMPL family transporter, partial [Spirochaetales bacterium]|nr:MMPL family transporter [Spirochaetales bacterium]